MWVEDFSPLKRLMDGLIAQGVADAAAWLKDNPDAALGLARDIRVRDVNQAAVDILEADSRDQLIGDLTGGFDDESYGPFLDELARIAGGERRFSIDISARSFKGRKKLLRMQWTAAPGHEEDLSTVVLSAVDLTDLVEAEHRLRVALTDKEFLLREIQHRVRNTLSLIESLIGLQAERSPAAAEALNASARRVEMLELVHDSLYREGDPSKAKLRDCVEGAVRQVAHSERAGTEVLLDLSCDEADLAVEHAPSVALIVGELASNALRHGRMDGRRPQVGIRARMDPDGRLELTVADNGRGFDPADEQGGSLGLKLVRALVEQLGGTMDIHASNSGTTVSMSLGLNSGTKL